ncbi:protein of unknown function (plasmid) [Azospirillum baldaniorum]|uniref:Uncharacterized protein n=1 Tax=Azospirillum baldaniorum TaxID=1064539 RepID=A0A9P1JUG2_9PROT|nr:protein of unknown function [Azospirillum baldaniorum]
MHVPRSGADPAEDHRLRHGGQHHAGAALRPHLAGPWDGAGHRRHGQGRRVEPDRRPDDGGGHGGPPPRLTFAAGKRQRRTELLEKRLAELWSMAVSATDAPTAMTMAAAKPSSMAFMGDAPGT